MNQSIRQGDVYLVPVNEIPESAKPVDRDGGRVVLAYGEVTGHAHAITAPVATLLTAEQDARFLRIVGSGATIVHEEHAAIDIAPGNYQVIIGREWDPEMGARQVVD